jgi:Flp pilus assembly protein TadB
MHVVTSLPSASVEPVELNAVMSDYLALELARTYRRLFVTRFGLLGLVLGIAGLAFHWLPAFAAWFCVAVCAVVPAWAWAVELRCDRRLARRLNELPGDPP